MTKFDKFCKVILLAAFAVALSALAFALHGWRDARACAAASMAEAR